MQSSKCPKPNIQIFLKYQVRTTNMNILNTEHECPNNVAYQSKFTSMHKGIYNSEYQRDCEHIAHIVSCVY